MSKYCWENPEIITRMPTPLEKELSRPPFWVTVAEVALMAGIFAMIFFSLCT